MTLEDHSGDDDDNEFTAEEVAAYEQWENASKKAVSAPMPHVDRLWEGRFDDWAGFQRMHYHPRLLEMAVEEGKEKALGWLKP